MKGLSPIIAGVLLLAFTVAIATIAGGWFGTFTRETTQTVSNQTKTGIECANANIKIDEVYVTPGSSAAVRAPIKNSGFNDLKIISAQIYDWLGNNHTASNMPISSFEKGELRTLSFSISSSGTNVTDSSDYNNNGILGNGTSGTSPTWASGKYHSSSGFDGTNDIIHINSSSSLRLTDQLTAEAWFYASNITANRDTTILRKDGIFYIAFRGQNGLYGSNNVNGHQLVCGLFINSTRTFGNFPYLSATEINASSSLVTLNQWHHIACTFNSTHAIMYLDGTAINTTSYTGSFQSSFCIDQYEASRSDATASSAGSSSTPASQQGVVPWASINQTDAKAACEAAGKHLCTDMEWTIAGIYNNATKMANPEYCPDGNNNHTDQNTTYTDCTDDPTYDMGTAGGTDRCLVGTTAIPQLIFLVRILPE